MSYRSLLLAGVALLAVPAPALAQWTAPVTVSSSEEANPFAARAFNGSVVLGWFERAASVARRDGDGFTAPERLNRADPFETVWATGLADDGEAVVVTARRHKPRQRIRATFVSNGDRVGPITISDRSHTAAQPRLDVAPDGTAVAAWAWHDPAGWRVQVAIRKPRDNRFGAPQNLSPPAVVGKQRPRPVFSVAAGPGGRAAVAWQVGGSSDLPEADLHVLTAGPNGVFGADQAFGEAGGFADVGLDVGSNGEVLLAYVDRHFSGDGAPSSLHVAQGVAGAPLSEPAVLSTGGKGMSSGEQVAAAFSAGGTATVAWGEPGDDYETGGTLEVFTRPAGGAFSAPQTVATGAVGIQLAGGPGSSTVLAWMRSPRRGPHEVHAVTRPQAGGPFGPDQRLGSPDRNALWPSVAMTPKGDAIAVWVTNTHGAGSGQPTAAIHRAD